MKVLKFAIIGVVLLTLWANLGYCVKVIDTTTLTSVSNITQGDTDDVSCVISVSGSGSNIPTYISLQAWNGTTWTILNGTAGDTPNITYNGYYGTNTRIGDTGVLTYDFRLNGVIVSKNNRIRCNASAEGQTPAILSGEGLVNVSSMPSGYLNISLLYPLTTLSLYQNETFNINASAMCLIGYCGNISIKLWVNTTANYPNTLLNDTIGATPFYLLNNKTWILNISVIDGVSTSEKYIHPSLAYIGDRWNLIAGNGISTFTGWTWTGSTWASNSTLISGLPATPSEYNLYPSLAYIGDRWNLIAGNFSGNFTGWTWTGSTWVYNSSLTSGLIDIGSSSTPTLHYIGDRWNLIAGNNSGLFTGWTWTGSTWASNSTLISGLSKYGVGSYPNMFNISGSISLISGNVSGLFTGWTWTGSTWVYNTSLIEGLTGVGLYATPSLAYIGDRWNLIAGNGTATGEAGLTGWTSNGVYRSLNPQNITLGINQQFNISWVLNATGLEGTDYLFNITIISDILNQNTTSNFKISIINKPEPTFINITLLTPENRSNITYNDVNFSYRPFANYGFTNCSLYINGLWNKTNSSAIVNNTIMWINQTGFLNQTLNWSIGCYANNTFNISSNFTLNISKAYPVAPPQLNYTSIPDIFGDPALVVCLDNETLYKEYLVFASAESGDIVFNRSRVISCAWGCSANACNPAPFQNYLNMFEVFLMLLAGLIGIFWVSKRKF